MDQDICPVCRKPLEVTQWKDIRSASGQVARRIPVAYACPDRCAQRVSTQEYNAAVSRLNKEQSQ